MKTNTLLALGILVSGWFVFGITFAGDESFRVEAPLTVSRPGLVEVVLPPGLHFPSTKGLDLRVVGPEGKTRPFELYWREEKTEEDQVLKEEGVQLLDNGRFRWEGRLEKPMKVRKILAYLSAGDYVGKVDIFGFTENHWKPLAHNAALYRADEKCWAEVNIPEGIYQDFRLEFVSYDQKYKRRLLPLEHVEATSEKSGKDYVEEELALNPQRIDAADKVILIGLLPGSGIWVKEVDLDLNESFVGDWTLQRREIVNGYQNQVTWRQGHVESLGKASGTLKMRTEDFLLGTALGLELRTQNFIGPIQKWTVVARLPRLVFRADREGSYRIQAGCGEETQVLEFPSAGNRGPGHAGEWGKVNANPDWKPESLVEKYHLGGGPFDGKGYAWQAPISLTAPGYYRVILNQKASLEGNTEGLRVVREDRQVPSFHSVGVMREIPLTVSENYDRSKNISIWPIELPQASARWDELSLKSEGIFNRTLLLEKQNPGSLVWEKVSRLVWSNREEKETETRIPIGGAWMEGVTKLRLTINHGDNRPITLKKVSVFYYAPAMCFLADASDGYWLAGGNPTATMPQYDLDLVQNDLLANEPAAAEMEDTQPFSGQGMKLKLFRAFSGTNWGLYAVLGLVTLAMIFLITWLFPAISDRKPKKR